MSRFAKRPSLLATLLLLVAADARAVTLTFVAPTPPAAVGSSLFVDVHAAGLTLGDAPSLTSFELDVSFDDTLLDFVGASFGPGLGPDLCTPATWAPGCDAFAEYSSATGLVELGSASLLDPAILNASQPESGVLATLEFSVQASGTSPLTFVEIALGGTISGTTEGVLAGTGTGSSVTVPEPARSAPLLAALAALLAASRRRRRATAAI